jgi:drug/metabolite transporter (DMT)-like permease
MRGAALLGSSLFFISGLRFLPIAEASATGFVAPLFVTALSIIFLGEKVGLRRWIATGVGLVGVLVILRPGIEAFQLAALGVLVASFGYAASNIATKKLIPVQSTIAIIFWMNVMQAGMALPGIDLAFPARLASYQWLWAFGLAFGGAFAHYCLTNALRVADAIVVIPLDFIRIPLIAFVGWMFYGERLDLLVFAGAGIIVSGIVWNLRAEMR